MAGACEDTATVHPAATHPTQPQPHARTRFACLALLLPLLLPLLLNACAGYRVGPTGGHIAREKSVQILFFSNQTLEPRLAEPVAQALRHTLQQDGTFRLASRKEDADIIVEGSLIEYERAAMAFQPRDLVSVQEYELRLRARVIARDRHTGASILDAEMKGRTTVSVGVDLNSAERQAIPLLAQDLARNITTALAEGSW